LIHKKKKKKKKKKKGEKKKKNGKRKIRMGEGNRGEKKGIKEK